MDSKPKPENQQGRWLKPTDHDNLAMMQFLDLTLPTAVENVALDEALVVAAEEGMRGSMLRVWELNHLAVILGASGRMAEDIRLEACRADGVAIARRSSGGGTVLIGPGALNFTVVLPIEFDPRLKMVDTAQIYVLERVAEALRAQDVDVQVLGSGDLTIQSRKFSGSAQRRLKRWVMVHASLIYGLGSEDISRYLNTPSRQPVYREGRSHEEFLTILPLARREIVSALRLAWPIDESASEPPWSLLSHLISDKFGQANWIERL